MQEKQQWKEPCFTALISTAVVTTLEVLFEHSLLAVLAPVKPIGVFDHLGAGLLGDP